MSRRRSRVLAACCCVALALAASSAAADMTKAQCSKANADGQGLRLDGKLAAARAQLQACGDPSCPAIVRDDCAQRLNELERVQPTIVFDVKDAAGSDLGAVSVAVDGQPLADRLGGLGLRVDPGEHVFTFTAAGRPAVTRRLILKEGEKDRRERIVLEATTVTPSAPAPAPVVPAPVTSAPPPEATPGSMSTQKVLGLVAAGVGVAGVAVGSVFGLLAFSATSQQKTDCASASSCTSHSQALSDHSTATTDGTMSTVGLIAGGALLVGGAVLFFTAPSATAAPSTGLSVSPSAGPGGAGVVLRGEF